jgi:copper chaperone CopZ
MTRFSLLRSLRLVLIAVAVGGLGLGLGPHTAAAQEGEGIVQVPDTADAVVRVQGMACPNCARNMRQALKGLDAVETADVKLEEQRAILTLKADRTVTEKALRTVVTEAGYRVRGVTLAGAGDEAPSLGE